MSGVGVETATEFQNVGFKVAYERVLDPSAGLYKFVCNTGTLALAAAAQSGNTCLFYFWNPVGSGKVIRIRRTVASQSGTVANPTTASPRIALLRITITGVGNATNVYLSPIDSGCGNPVAYAANASTNAAVTVLGISRTLLKAASIMTAVGAMIYVEDIQYNAEDAQVLHAGEGLAIQQVDAGSTGEHRTFDVDIYWDETAY